MRPFGLLYHANRHLLAPGALVQAGNYGRIIASRGDSHPHWMREQILEQVRATEFPEKPSRLNAAFACLDLDIARCYQSVHCSEGFLYEAEVVRPSLPWHIGDFNAVDPLPRTDHGPEEAARRYWQHKDRTTVQGWGQKYCDEYVTLSPLRIIQLVSQSGTEPSVE